MLAVARALSESKLRVRSVGPFSVIGEGIMGGKAQRLFDDLKKIERAGMVVPEETVVLTTGFFGDLYYQARHEALRWGTGLDMPHILRFHGTTMQELIEGYETRLTVSPEEFQMALRSLNASLSEKALLRAVRDHMPEFVVARSSHKNECGGNGKYYSGFSLRPHNIFEQIRRVLVSSADEDMAVMLQPAIGEYVDFGYASKYFFPPIAGCAYSTRFADSGDGKIILTQGFGTRAVGASVDHYAFGRGEIRQIEKSSFPDRIDLIRFWSGDVKFETTEMSHDRFQSERERVLDVLPAILKELERLNGGIPVYIEFAFVGGMFFCLQLADTVPLDNSKLELSENGVLLARSTKVGGVERRFFKELIWSPKPGIDRRILTRLDSERSNYLLAVNSSAFSMVNPNRLFREHIPHAGAVVSLLTDYHMMEEIAGEHTKGALGRLPFIVVPVDSFASLLRFEKLEEDIFIAKVPILLEVNEASGLGQLRLL